MADHLARLSFEGPDSSGRYTPQAFNLRLRGVEQPTDHVVYLHEVHHAALNDVTAWGSALHVYARLPGDIRHQFGQLLDACRTTHESLATFASVQIASARHGNVDHVLAAYPSYIPLYQATVRLTTGVEGLNRRQLAITALARLCMQTPVLETILDIGLDGFRLAGLRHLDRPDGRWSWFARHGPNLLATAAQAADRAVIARFGPATLISDGPANDLYTSTDRTHDDAWDLWEASAYDQLRIALADTGAQTFGLTGHQSGTRALLTLVHHHHGDIGLRPSMDDSQRQDDAAVASSVLQQVRHDLHTGERYRATLIAAADVAQIVDAAAGQPAINNGPAMIVDARPARRLAELYRWPGDALPERLQAPNGPLVSVRRIVDDAESDRSIGHAVLPEPDALAALSELWHGRGPLVCCVSASCLADAQWTRRWWPAINSLHPPLVLVDVEPDRFVPAWVRDGREVIAVGLTVDDTAGRRAALVFTADDGAVWWLVVADDVTVRLVSEYLRASLGPRFRSDLEPFNRIRETVTATITHLLATESFVSFDALGTPNV